VPSTTKYKYSSPHAWLVHVRYGYACGPSLCHRGDEKHHDDADHCIEEKGLHPENRLLHVIASSASLLQDRCSTCRIARYGRFSILTGSMASAGVKWNIWA
jgi:hypothetical protein